VCKTCSFDSCSTDISGSIAMRRALQMSELQRLLIMFLWCHNLSIRVLYCPVLSLSRANFTALSVRVE